MAEIFDFGFQKYRLKLSGVYNQGGLFAVVGDTARRVEVQLLDAAGRVTDTTGIELSLSTPVGQSSSYVDANLIDASKGLYQVDLTNGLFLKPGKQDFQWTIYKDGKQINSVISRWHIYKNVSEGGNQSFNFYLNADDLKRKQDEIKGMQADMEAENAAMISETESMQQEIRDIQQDFVDDTVESEALRISIEQSVEERYSNLEADYAQDLSELKQSDTELTTELKQIYVNVCQPPYNVSANGEDVSEKINRAISDVSNKGGGVVYIPNSVDNYMVDPLNSIQLKDNTTLRFDNGATLEALPVDVGSYNILHIADVKNICVEGNGFIIGERYKHIGSHGAWGMGIRVEGSNHIRISDLTIKDCWGDGIYIAGTPSQIYTQDLTIENVTLDNNRRQGISLISGIDITIRDVKAINTNGALPSAGIDIESNNSSEYIKNILIDNFYTENNAGAGIHIYTRPMGTSENEVTITIRNHTDRNSLHGLYIFGGSQNNRGFIKIENPIWETKGKGLNIEGWDVTNPPITITDMDVITNLTSDEGNDYPVMLTHGLESELPNPILGNIHLIRPRITVKKDTVKPKRGIVIVGGSQIPYIENITIENPFVESVSETDTEVQILPAITKNVSIIDNNNLLKKIQTDTTPLTASSNVYKKIYTNSEDVQGECILHPNLSIGLEIEIINNSRDTFHIRSALPFNIFQLNGPSIRRIEGYEKGASIKLLKVAEREFVITNMVGEWTGFANPL